MSAVEEKIAKKITEELLNKKLLAPSQLIGLSEKMHKITMTESDWRMLAELSIKEEERNAAQTPNS